jgi:hypothetical protein
VAHFPSCSPVVVVVSNVFEQRFPREMPVRVSLRCKALSVPLNGAMAMDTATASLFFHPLQSPLPEPADRGTPLAWTPDIDDMLLLISRQHAFDFAVVATHVQRYIRNVHAAGGMLPKRVRRSRHPTRPQNLPPPREPPATPLRSCR